MSSIEEAAFLRDKYRLEMEANERLHKALKYAIWYASSRLSAEDGAELERQVQLIRFGETTGVMNGDAAK